jgi:transcriptional regulator with XRE-family HTH domain
MTALEADDYWVPEDNFGARLALVRQRMGWNVKQAAEACGFGAQSWHNWEDGKNPRGFETVARQISDATGCNLVWLLAGDRAVPRSRCFSSLSLVSDLDGQMELDFRPAPVLASV